METHHANIVIIDFDTPFAARLSEHLVAEGYSVELFCSKPALDSLLSSERWRQPSASTAECELVITELFLGDQTSFSLLSRVKTHAPHTPVVFMSGQAGIKDLVYALRQGVDDYLLKPLNDLTIVSRVIEKALGHCRLAQKHEQAQAELRRLNLDLRNSMAVLERDQKAGRLVQEQFLPISPSQLAGIDVSFEIIPSLYLSGDSVDYGLIGGRYLAFYLTDVSGHGSASAFVTVWVKQFVRGLFRDSGLFQTQASFEQDLPKLMANLNEALLRANLDPHLTCMVGVIDTESLVLNYVVAGHLPLPLLIKSGRAEYLSGQGKPLGLFPDAEWKMNSLQLDEHFSLVVFSDGVLELFDDVSLDDKEARLIAALDQLDSGQLDELRRKLPLANRETVPDDVTMLILTR